MSKFVKTIYISSIALIFTVGVFVGGLFLGNVGAETNIGTYVNYNNNISVISVQASKVLDDDSNTTISSVPNGSFAMLENVGKAENEGKEIIRFVIKANATNVYISALPVNVYLNGRQISLGVNSIVENESIEVTQGGFTDYIMSFEITGEENSIQYYNSSEYVTDFQGLYEFYFSPTIYNNGTTITYPTGYNWYRYGFYLLDQESYGIDNVSDTQFPRISNVTASDLPSDNYLRFNTFNFNKSESDTPLFPELSMDAEKYAVAYVKKENYQDTTYTSNFTYTNSSGTVMNEVTDYGRLSFTSDKDNVVISFDITRNLDGLMIFDESNYTIGGDNCANYTEPLFYEVATYEINYQYLIWVNNAFVKESLTNQTLPIGVEKLVVFGFDLKYSNVDNETTTFASFENGYFSDITYKNINAWSNSSNGLTGLNCVNTSLSTNQAPIWLEGNSELTSNAKYYFSDSAISDLSLLTSTRLTKNTYFTEAGYYVVLVEYTDSQVASSVMQFRQVFSFRITNNTPTVSIYEEEIDNTFDSATTLNGTNTNYLYSNAYTMNSVKIGITEPGIFDTAIRCYYSFIPNFSGTQTSYTLFDPYLDSENYGQTFSANGRYLIRVYFSSNSFSDYSFNIDKQELQDLIVVNGITMYQLGSTKQYSLKSDADYTSDLSINDLFTVYANAKDSGAPITATVTTIDIVESENDTQTELYTSADTLSKYIMTDYIATNASSPQTYSNVRAKNASSNLVSSQNVFSAHKIYIFQFTDASGYQAIQVVYYDDSTANFIQTDRDGNYVEIETFNVVSEVTNINFGNAKSLVFPDEYIVGSSITATRNASARNLLAEYSSQFQINAGTFMLMIPITNKDVSSDSLIYGVELGQSYADLNSNEVYSFTVYPDFDEYVSIENRFKGEKIYTVTLTDDSGNESTLSIEMNMDRSRGTMYSTDTPIKNITSDYAIENNRLQLNRAGSYDALCFQWKDNSDGIYKIAELSYNFYPLTFDTTSSNYPYSETPTKTNISLLDDYLVYDADNLIFYSGMINPTTVSYEYYNEEGALITGEKTVTELGMYEIVRVYQGGAGEEEEFAESGDSKTRSYVFYADSNPIISVPDFIAGTPSEVGSGIQLLLGQDQVSFDEFYREAIKTHTYFVSSGSTITDLIQVSLSSNLLPIVVQVPVSKYSFVNGSQVLNTSIPSVFNLVVTVKYYVGLNLISTTEYSTVDNGFIIIDNFSKAGIYVISIRDDSLAPNDEISPYAISSDYFAFEIKHDQPESEVLTAKTELSASPTEPITISTGTVEDIGGVYTATFIIDNAVNATEPNIDTSNIVIEVRQKVGLNAFGSYTDLSDVSNDELRVLINNLKVERNIGIGNQKVEHIYYLPAFGTSGLYTVTYQYRITTKYVGEDESNVQWTPLVSDFDTYSVLSEDKTSTSSSVLVFTFYDPVDEFYAGIDETDIVIKQSYKLASGAYSSEIQLVNNVDYTIESRWVTSDRKLYTISLNADNANGTGKQYKYNITYHYVGDRSFYVFQEGDSIVDYYSKVKTLIIDRTAPSYNLKNLANMTVNMNVLSANEIASAYSSSNYLAQDGVYYYANSGLIDFAINEDYEFTLPSVSASLPSTALEGSQIYFRKYSKYDVSAYSSELAQRAYQSLVPGMAEYYESTNSRIRFNANYSEASLPSYENWVEFGYNYGSFYDYVSSYLGGVDPYGYYEIVEIDEAGNHTVYTVLLGENDLSVNFNVNSTDGSLVVTADADNTTISSFNMTSISSINANDDWFTITLDSFVYNVSPDSDLDSIVQSLNSKFAVNNSYTLTITNRFGSSLIIKINIASAGDVLGVKSVAQTPNTSGYYKVTFDDDINAVFMSKITAYKFDTALREYVLVENDGVACDSRLVPIVIGSDTLTRQYYFAVGVWKFYIEDNFRIGVENANVVTVNIGMTGNWSLEFAEDSVLETDTNMTFTSGAVTLDVPTDMFDVAVTKDGVAVNVADFPYIFRPSASVTNFDVTSGSSNVYVITITNLTTDEVTTQTFTIYNIFPAVAVTDDLGLDMSNIIGLTRDQVSTFTSKSITLEWGSVSGGWGYTVQLLKYTTGSVPTSTTTITGSKTSVSSEGIYELKFINKFLGSSRSLYFMIKKSDISMYQVYEVLSSGNNAVLPSSNLLDISAYEDTISAYLDQIFHNIYPESDRTMSYPLTNSRLMVKNYFSKYNFLIEVEGDKNLTTNYNNLEYVITYTYTNEELQETFTTSIIFVYGVTPYSYLDIFAITKIQANSDFVDNMGYVYEDSENPKDVNIEGYNYVTIYDAPVKLYWQNYYGVSQNLVYIKYSYNGTYVGTTYGTVMPDSADINYFLLSVAGEYQFEFYDLAGNKQLFGSTNSEYLTVALRSEVLFTVNGDDPIYGAVYNDAVALAILQPSNYVNGTIQVSILRNGALYEVTPINYVYTFTEQGLYTVNIIGSVVEGINTRELKQTTLLFNIINDEEARFAYEFTDINGFVITSVIKNNIDITDIVRGNNANIYSLLVSAESFGVGKYHIYVRGSSNNALLSTKSYDFYVWVNNEIPVINCSIAYGTESVSNIIVNYNELVIFQQVGKCRLIIDGGGTPDEVVINELATDVVKTATITRAGTYYITLQTEAGNIVSMFMVIKNDPLNFVAIIIIIAVVAVVIVGSILFFRLRVKMKIK